MAQQIDAGWFCPKQHLFSGFAISTRFVRLPLLFSSAHLNHKKILPRGNPTMYRGGRSAGPYFAQNILVLRMHGSVQFQKGFHVDGAARNRSIFYLCANGSARSWLGQAPFARHHWRVKTSVLISATLNCSSNETIHSPDLLNLSIM